MTKPKRRAPRAQRGTSPTLSLQPRDIEVLVLVSLMRWVTAEQIDRDLSFSSLNYCTKRLRRLFEAGLLDVAVRDAFKPNLYQLGEGGLATLVVRAPEIAGRVRLHGPIDPGRVDHHLGLVDTRLYAAALGQARGHRLLQWAEQGEALENDLGLAAFGISPDALAIFDTPGRTTAIAVQVDIGAASEALVAHRLRQYRALASQSRAVDALWIVGLAGRARVAAVQRLAEQAGLGAWSRVLDRAHVVARPVQDLPRRRGNRAYG